MNDLLLVTNSFRSYAGQLLTLCLSYWPTCIPFVFLAFNEIYELLKKIK